MINSPLPRGRQPRYHEASGLRSSRDSDALARAWIKERTVGHNNGGTDRQMFYMLQKLARQRRRIVGGGGGISSGLTFKGEYNNGPYQAQNLVAYTPAGGSAGMYIALVNVPAGVLPDTGNPYWFAWPNSPAGMWGV